MRKMKKKYKMRMLPPLLVFKCFLLAVFVFSLSGQAAEMGEEDEGSKYNDEPAQSFVTVDSKELLDGKYFTSEHELKSNSDYGNLTEESCQVSVRVAMDVAANWLKSRYPNKTEKRELAKVHISRYGDKNAFYIVNFEPSAFVVVSGSYTEYPIMAYAIDSKMDLENMNPALLTWLTLPHRVC